MREFFIDTGIDGMYVQEWSPAVPDASRRMIMVHGGSHTGVVWTMRLTAEPSWTELFTDLGWTVYVIDWPGVGRSGYAEDFLTMSPSRIVDSLTGLLDQIGPAVLMGHSIGGVLSMLCTARGADRVSALVALAPAPLANTPTEVPNVPLAPLDRPVRTTRDAAQRRFANTTLFPQDQFGSYFRTLVPYSPNIRNAAMGGNRGFWMETTDWATRLPFLLLAAEEDQTTECGPTADFLGVPQTLLGRDWGMQGHGHLFPVEHGNRQIAERIAGWLDDGL